jgi:hypothetical protein
MALTLDIIGPDRLPPADPNQIGGFTGGLFRLVLIPVVVPG